MLSDTGAPGKAVANHAIALGGLICLATMPRLAIAIQAVRELRRADASHFMFIDYVPAHWVSVAFLAAHTWLGWALWQRRRGGTLSPAAWGIVIAIACQVLAVYGMTTWLRWRGFGLGLF
jgi:hypothetical protein